MNRPFRPFHPISRRQVTRSTAAFCVAGLLWLAAASTRAEPPPPKTVVVAEPVEKVHVMRAAHNAHVHRVIVPNPEADILVRAYRILEHADHDYKGHRILAMKQIEAACHTLHVDVRGDGVGHEAQPTSDAQLQQADQLLQQAKNEFAARKQVRIVEHINAALTQLSIALKIK